MFTSSGEVSDSDKVVSDSEKVSDSEMESGGHLSLSKSTEC